MDRTTVKKRLFFWYSIFWVLFFGAVILAYKYYFIATTTTKPKWVGLFAGVCAILFSSFKMLENSFVKYDDECNKYISSFLYAFKNCFSYIDKILIPFFILSLILSYFHLGKDFSVCFLAGFLIAKFFSLINIKTLLKTSLSQILNFDNEFSFKTMLSCGMIVSFLSFGLVLSSVVILFHIYKDYQIISGFALGFAFVYAIYSITNLLNQKSVDMANDVVENEIVSNNSDFSFLQFIKKAFNIIGHVHFQMNDYVFSFLISLICAIMVGALCEFGLMACFFPFIICANLLFSAIFVFALIKIKQETDYLKLYISTNIFVFVLYSLLLAYTTFNWFSELKYIFLASLIGAVSGIVINFYFLRKNFYVADIEKGIVNSSITGIKHIFLQTFKECFKNSLLYFFTVMLLIFVGFVSAYGMQAPIGGVWGITIAILTMLSFACINLAFTVFSQNLSNIKILAKDYVQGIDFGILDDIGERFDFVFRKFLNFSNFLIIISIILAFCMVANIQELDLLNPFNLLSLLVGFFVCALFIYLSISMLLKMIKNTVLNVENQIKLYFCSETNELDMFNINIIKYTTLPASFMVLLLLLLINVFPIFILSVFHLDGLAVFLLSVSLFGMFFWFILSNFPLFLNLAISYLTKEYINAKDGQQYIDLTNLKDASCAISDYICPILTVLIKLFGIIALTVVPVIKNL